MHRVLNLNSVGTDATTMEVHKLAIRGQLEINDTHEAQVNDGQDEGGNITLAIVADFNHVDEANTFHTWLKDYINTNAVDFTMARSRVHDCHHAAGQSLPCMIGDVWNFTPSTPEEI